MVTGCGGGRFCRQPSTAGRQKAKMTRRRDFIEQGRIRVIRGFSFGVQTRLARNPWLIFRETFARDRQTSNVYSAEEHYPVTQPIRQRFQSFSPKRFPEADRRHSEVRNPKRCRLRACPPKKSTLKTQAGEMSAPLPFPTPCPTDIMTCDAVRKGHHCQYSRERAVHVGVQPLGCPLRAEKPRNAQWNSLKAGHQR